MNEHAARSAPILRRCDSIPQRLLRHVTEKIYRKYGKVVRSLKINTSTLDEIAIAPACACGTLTCETPLTCVDTRLKQNERDAQASARAAYPERHPCCIGLGLGQHPGCGDLRYAAEHSRLRTCKQVKTVLHDTARWTFACESRGVLENNHGDEGDVVEDACDDELDACNAQHSAPLTVNRCNVGFK
jgi:hypothetical protein